MWITVLKDKESNTLHSLNSSTNSASHLLSQVGPTTPVYIIGASGEANKLMTSSLGAATLPYNVVGRCCTIMTVLAALLCLSYLLCSPVVRWLLVAGALWMAASFLLILPVTRITNNLFGTTEYVPAYDDLDGLELSGVLILTHCLVHESVTAWQDVRCTSLSWILVLRNLFFFVINSSQSMFSIMLNSSNISISSVNPSQSHEDNLIAQIVRASHQPVGLPTSEASWQLQSWHISLVGELLVRAIGFQICHFFSNWSLLNKSRKIKGIVGFIFIYGFIFLFWDLLWFTFRQGPQQEQSLRGTEHRYLSTDWVVTVFQISSLDRIINVFYSVTGAALESTIPHYISMHSYSRLRSFQFVPKFILFVSIVIMLVGWDDAADLTETGIVPQIRSVFILDLMLWATFREVITQIRRAIPPVLVLLPVNGSLPEGYSVTIIGNLARNVSRYRILYNIVIETGNFFRWWISLVRPDPILVNGESVSWSDTCTSSASSPTVIEESMHDDIKRDCVICCEDIIPFHQATTLLPCRHTFHNSCLVLWLENSLTCPTCRRPVYSLGAVPTTNVSSNSFNSGAVTHFESPIRSYNHSDPVTPAAYWDSDIGFNIHETGVTVAGDVSNCPHFIRSSTSSSTIMAYNESNTTIKENIYNSVLYHQPDNMRHCAACDATTTTPTSTYRNNENTATIHVQLGGTKRPADGDSSTLERSCSYRGKSRKHKETMSITTEGNIGPFSNKVISDNIDSNHLVDTLSAPTQNVNHVKESTESKKAKKKRNRVTDQFATERSTEEYNERFTPTPQRIMRRGKMNNSNDYKVKRRKK